MKDAVIKIALVMGTALLVHEVRAEVPSGAQLGPEIGAMDGLSDQGHQVTVRSTIFAEWQDIEITFKPEGVFWR